MTNTKVSYVENDAECANKHRAEIESVAKGKLYVGKTPNQERVSKKQIQSNISSNSPVLRPLALHVNCLLRLEVFVAGDQEDVNVLSEIVEDAKFFSGYDIIVDDGGHKASQMLASFKVSIKPRVPSSRSTG